MSIQPRHDIFGTSLEEWIETIHGDLPVDPVGLWEIIPAGRIHFGLTEHDLVSYTRRCISSLLEHGAKPVRGGRKVGRRWLLQEQYGTDVQDIVDAIISEWRGWGFGDPTLDGLWFALPEFYEA